MNNMPSLSNRILVIGDTCTDVFVYGSCERICPEAPAPVFLPIRSTANRGMTGNVVDNIKALGYDCDSIENEENIIKTRYIELKTGQMLMRLDENDIVKHKYIRDEEKLKGYRAIVVSDYGKGFLNENDIAFIAKFSNCTTFLQTSKILSEWCFDIDFIKINELEFNRTKHILNVQSEFIKNSLIVTLGSSGCWYKDKGYPVENEVNVKSLAGAGDTFLAGLVVEYIKTGGDIDSAITFAQRCAMRVIREQGVTTL